MQIIRYLLFFISLNTWSQAGIEVLLTDKTALNVDKFVQVDNFDQLYYISNNQLNVQRESGTFSYSNIQLGNITSISAFNPLKLNIFYKDFNAAVVLDNRLSEITKVNFNTLSPFRNVTHISTGNDNAIWIFNENTRQLELFDYLLNKTKTTSLPVDGKILDLQSDYNYCWLLTDTYIYTYNYFGSLISKRPNFGYTMIEIDNQNLFLLKDNNLFFKSQNADEIKIYKLPELLIKQFFVTNETLYIYNGEYLYRYQLIID